MAGAEGRAGLAPGWLGQRIPRACIVGLGLMGGSWAGALHRLGWQVSAVERDTSSLTLAVQKGWIQEGWQEIPPVLDVDLVILALPIKGLQDELSLQFTLSPGTIVTDVGSVKSRICQKYGVESWPGSYFIGGHPMTGSEKSGFGAADPELFQGYPYVLTPEADCPQEVLVHLERLLGQVGALVVYRDAAEHDKQVAMVSHIPHLLAVSLTLAADELAGTSALDLAGRSFRELTRIAESSPEMWQEILVDNSAAILSSLECWQRQLDRLSACVQAQDGEGIATAFRTASKIRQNLGGRG